MATEARGRQAEQPPSVSDRAHVNSPKGTDQPGPLRHYAAEGLSDIYTSLPRNKATWLCGLYSFNRYLPWPTCSSAPWVNFPMQLQTSTDQSLRK